jgi:hypothetical protein
MQDIVDQRLGEPRRAAGRRSHSLAPLLEEAGFHVLWRVQDHFDHIHVDTCGAGGGIGSGGGPGGGLHKSYEIRLVAYEG